MLDNFMNVVCDNCEKEFPATPKCRKKRDIEKIYFTCPHCNTSYTAYYTDNVIRHKQKEIRTLISQIRKTKDEELRNELLMKHKLLSVEIGTLLLKLREKMESN